MWALILSFKILAYEWFSVPVDNVFCLTFIATYYQTFLILAYHFVYRYKTVTRCDDICWTSQLFVFHFWSLLFRSFISCHQKSVSDSLRFLICAFQWYWWFMYGHLAKGALDYGRHRGVHNLHCRIRRRSWCGNDTKWRNEVQYLDQIRVEAMTFIVEA